VAKLNQWFSTWSSGPPGSSSGPQRVT